MKQILHNLYWQGMDELRRMKKAKMSLADRISYEKAIVYMETLKKLIDSSEIIFKQ